MHERSPVAKQMTPRAIFHVIRRGEVQQGRTDDDLLVWSPVCFDEIDRALQSRLSRDVECQPRIYADPGDVDQNQTGNGGSYPTILDSTDYGRKSNQHEQIRKNETANNQDV